MRVSVSMRGVCVPFRLSSSFFLLYFVLHSSRTAMVTNLWHEIHKNKLNLRESMKMLRDFTTRNDDDDYDDQCSNSIATEKEKFEERLKTLAGLQRRRRHRQRKWWRETHINSRKTLQCSQIAWRFFPLFSFSEWESATWQNECVNAPLWSFVCSLYYVLPACVYVLLQRSAFSSVPHTHAHISLWAAHRHPRFSFRQIYRSPFNNDETKDLHETHKTS